jgi:hypothetical protein
MPERIDILTHSDGRPQIQDGDLVAGPADRQHQEDILLAAPGHLINAPLLGVDLYRWMKALDTPANRQALRRDILQQLALDGYDDAQLDLDSLMDWVFRGGLAEVGN